MNISEGIMHPGYYSNYFAYALVWCVFELTSMKKNTTRKFKNFPPANAYHNFVRDVPILNEIFQKYPHLLASYENYKGNTYYAINKFLRNNTVTTGEYYSEDLVTNKPKLQALYTTYLDHSDKVYAKVLTIVNHIQNLFTLLDKFTPYRIHPLPVLYRGIQRVPGSTWEPDALLNGEPISLNYFQSCSKSYQIALSEQRYGEYGPCCIYVLHLSPDVKYLPMFWTDREEGKGKMRESYTHSEHEILIEPYVQYTLRKQYVKEFSVSELTNVRYDGVPPTISVQVYEVDVLPPPVDARARLDAFYKQMCKGIRSIQDNNGIIIESKEYTIHMDKPV
jgi:hypothetical protein